MCFMIKALGSFTSTGAFFLFSKYKVLKQHTTTYTLFKREVIIGGKK